MLNFNVTYLPANQRYCVTYGDGQILAIDDQSLFETRQELVDRAALVGLTVHDNSDVTLEKSPCGLPTA